MDFERLAIPDVIQITPRRGADSRGFFSETFRADAFEAHGLDALRFVQDNHVYSTQKGVLRGLHFQLRPRAQGKLVRCTRGAIFDVGRFGQVVEEHRATVATTQHVAWRVVARGRAVVDDRRVGTAAAAERARGRQ